MGMNGRRRADGRTELRWMALRQAAVVAAAVGWAAAPPPVVAGGATSPFAAEAQGVRDPEGGGAFLAEAGLEAVGEEDFVDPTLDGLAAKLCKKLGCRVEVDHEALRNHDRRRNGAGFAVPARGVPLRDALEVGLDSEHASFVVEGSGLRLTSMEDALSRRRNRAVRYDVSDLAPDEAGREDLDALLETAFAPHGRSGAEGPTFATEVDGSGRATLTATGLDGRRDDLARLLVDLRAAAAEARGRPVRKLLPPARRPGK